MKYLVVKEEKNFAESPGSPRFLEMHEPVWGSDNEQKAIDFARNEAERNPGVVYAVYERGPAYKGVPSVVVAEEAQ